MEHSEPTPVLPIVLQALLATSAAAPIGNQCKTRRNKMMLPKYYHLKSLGGSSINSPRETLSSLTRIYLKALGGSRINSPREMLSSLTRLYIKALGGSRI